MYEDSIEHQQYIDWSAKWISAVHRVLNRNGTFWLAIGDDYAAELKVESRKVGFLCRSWVIWYYTFGVNCSRKFTRSHTHLFHLVKDRQDFTFRDEDLDNRIPSARELVYNDKRANPDGRLPDDTWIIRPVDAIGELTCDDEESPVSLQVAPPADADRTFTLRPQDLDHCFKPDENTWYFPRVAGTFKERAGFHGCQMPEQFLGRIIRTCSNPGDIILDPFSGSATTLAVAKKLGRRFIGFDISKDYVRYGRERLAAIRVGDRLDGSPEPLKSAPRTTDRPKKKGLSRRSEPAASLHDGLHLREKRYNEIQLEMTHRGITEAFQRTHDGFSIDRIVADPDPNREFVTASTKLGLAGDPRTWNMLLFRLRKAGRLSHIETPHRTSIPWEKCDKYMFASEIAWQTMLEKHFTKSLDEILCDPDLAAQFDEIARRFAPGYKPLDYRWAALKLRKKAKYARSRAAILKPPARIGKMLPIEELAARSLPDGPCLYMLSQDRRSPGNLYVGETLNLRDRLNYRRAKAWWRNPPFPDSIFIQTLAINYLTAGRLAWQSCLVKQFKPRYNCFELRSAS